MDQLSTPARPCLPWVIAVGLAIVISAPSAAQQAPERPSLAVFDVPFYGKGANSLDPGDTESGTLVTRLLLSDLQRTGKFAIIDAARLHAAVDAADEGDVPCSTIECRRGVARKLGAVWMVTGQFSKTSNLIWYMQSQLTDVVGKRRFMDVEFELKGRRDEVAELGASYVARRIVTTADRAGAALGDSAWAGHLEVADVRRRLDAAKGGQPPNLAGADLSRLNLSGVDFRGANLARASLSGANLSGANLVGANLTDARLDGATLNAAKLDRAILRRADLRTAELRGASLTAVDAPGADLSYSDLSGANLTGANLATASLAHAILAGATLPEKSISNAR